jgi:hypothetical protein
VPLVGSAVDLPDAADWLAITSLILASLAILVCRRESYRYAGWILWVAAAFGLILLDQHRLQPWFYHGLLIAILRLIFGPDRKSRTSEYDSGNAWLSDWHLRLLRLITVSIYLYSAAGKFDSQFLHTVGPQIVDAALQWVGVQLNYEALVALSCLLPLVELAVGLGLCFVETRKVAAVFAMGMHLLLIAVLGIGMRQQPSVLIWNGFFAAQTLCLFLGSSQRQAITAQTKRRKNRLGVAMLFSVTVMALPLSERFGYWDHWLSWALYAPHSSRVQVQVAPTALDRLPDRLTQLLAETVDPNQVSAVDWQNIPIDQWSLATLGVPIYPQSRFQLGVASALANLQSGEFDIRIIEQSVANRFSGSRQQSTITGRTALDERARKYWWNTQPSNFGSDLSLGLEPRLDP